MPQLYLADISRFARLRPKSDAYNQSIEDLPAFATERGALRSEVENDPPAGAKRCHKTSNRWSAGASRPFPGLPVHNPVEYGTGESHTVSDH